MFERSELNINSYRTDISKADKVILNDSNTIFGFSFYDENDDLLTADNTTWLQYINVTATNSFYNYSYSNRRLDIIKCNETNYKDKINFSDYPVENCIDFNNSQISGNYYSILSENYFIYFKIDLDVNNFLNRTNSSITSLFL
jgi:hypothetical protein